VFGLCAVWISPAVSSAQNSGASRRKSSGWVSAQIYVDGAAIYEKPNFDSKVQDYLRYQTKVMVSKKAFRGIGGMGLFHRIRYGKKFGYVPDTDVRVAAPEAEKAQSAAPEKTGGSKAWEKEEQEVLGKAPLYFTRYLGGAVSMVQFTEKFSGKKYSDNMMMYGLRMSGPGTLFDGPPLDFNFWFSLDKPDYYSNFAQKPSGFLMFGDVMIQLPLIDGKNTLLTYGIGVMWVYTRYKVPVRQQSTGRQVTFDSQELRVGLDAGIGLGRKIGKTMLRLDTKYYYEKTQYFGYILSLQGEY